MRPTRTLLLVPATLISMGLAGCGGGSTIAPPLEDIRDYITDVATSGGIDAVFHSGFTPAAGGGPTLTISGISAMITGGSAIRDVSSATAFSRVIVAIEGVDGYWEITLPTEVTTEELVVTVAQLIPDRQITLRYGAAAVAGFGPYEIEFASVILVGTGPLQVSVSWNTNADVDLYVDEPGTTGEEIYWENTSSAYGGTLDLDSNAGCTGDNIRNENITYSTAPPSGAYVVKVNLWADCGATSTDYVVTVRKQGQAPTTYTGILNAPGVGGGAGAGSVVTTIAW